MEEAATGRLPTALAAQPGLAADPRPANSKAAAFARVMKAVEGIDVEDALAMFQKNCAAYGRAAPEQVPTEAAETVVAGAESLTAAA